MVGDIATVFGREWLLLSKRLGKFMLSRMIAPLLYLIAFGWGIGRNIPMNGGSYLDFIVPGIMALNAMNISFNSVGGPLHTSRMFTKNLEEYLVAPISPLSFVIGELAAGVLRGLLSSVVILALAYVFGAHIQVGAAFIGVLVLNCLVFAAMGFAVAMLIDGHEEMGNFSTYVLLPMSFLCGTFFNTAVLPGAVRILLDLLPLTHASHALRLLGTGQQAPLYSWAVLLVYAAALIALCVWTMRKVRE